MKNYKVVYAISYNVEAEDENEAEAKAQDAMSRDLGRAVTNVVVREFGVNVEEDDILDGVIR